MQDRRGEKGAGSLGEDGGPERGGAIARLDDGGCCGRVEITARDANGMHSTSTTTARVSVCSSNPFPDPDDLRGDHDGSPALRAIRVKIAIDSTTFEAPRVANVPMGTNGLLFLWDPIAGKLARAKMQVRTSILRPREALSVQAI